MYFMTKNANPLIAAGSDYHRSSYPVIYSGYPVIQTAQQFIVESS